jgi:hypothetical protein
MLNLVRKFTSSPLVLYLLLNLTNHQSVHEIFTAFQYSLFDILSRDKARNCQDQLIIPGQYGI